MQRHAKRYRPTAAQQTMIRAFGRRFAEHGYYIAPVAERFRRHESDFIALPKDAPRQFVIVRAAPTRVVIRPYGEQRPEVQAIIRSLRALARPRLVRARPRLAKAQPEEPWIEYADESAREEISTLIEACA